MEYKSEFLKTWHGDKLIFSFIVCSQIFFGNMLLVRNKGLITAYFLETILYLECWQITEFPQ